MLWALLVAAAGVWLFAIIASEVVEGDTKAFDEWAVRKLRRADDPSIPIGPKFVRISALDATALGSTLVLTLVIATVAGLLWLQKLRGAFWLILGATLGGQLLSALLKGHFERTRPDVVPHLAEVQTSSFPSGHSMMAAVVYLTLGTLAAQFVAERRVRIYVFCVAALVTLMVGASRVYLGVHYPTDVLAGWTAGLTWALICWAVARYLQQRGTVEPPQQTISAPLAQVDEDKTI